METKTQPIIALILIFISISNFPSSLSQSSQNIQTFYPFPLPPIGRSPTSPTNGTPPPPPHEKKSSTKKAVVVAVTTTAIGTLLLSALLFFFIQKRTKRQIERKNRPNPFARDGRTVPTEFSRFNNKIKGVVVDEDGLDVVYWKNLNGEKAKNKLNKQVLKINSSKKLEDKRVISGSERRRKEPQQPSQESPLLRDKSSSSHQIWQNKENESLVDNPPTIVEENQSSSIESTAISAPPPPPPPKPVSLASVPPPPLPVVAKVAPKPPPTPPPKPPQVPKGESSSKEAMKEDEKGQVKLKPLHWDKVNPNVEHSMVWHKMEGGSFKFDDDLMEALFGSVAANRKSPKNQPSSSSEKSNSPPTQIMILDPRKSQNTAIVLRSLAISRKEIIDALNEGRGLDVDTLEKLSKIAPTKEEESQILAYDDDPTRLADAESFLFHLLKKVPSAFPRFDTMLFRSTYESEILQLRECLGTLEMACKELKSRGLFLKLLEAILKAGNRMNAGTSRGNAQAFNLTALRKLSDVKSTDGKTTLLHFVVEEVIRAEGKKCVLNKSGNSQNPETSQNSEEKDREYIKLGLPVVGGLSNDFSSVKKAAFLDYDTLSTTSSVLSLHVDEIRRNLGQWGRGDRGGFVREINNFVEIAEMELKVLKEEQTRIMELVMKTREYYQAGSSKDIKKHPLQLFVIVKDFLGMVDNVCIDIARNSQKKRSVATNAESSSAKSSDTKYSVRFPLLPSNFMSSGSSSDSDDEGKKEIKQ